MSEISTKELYERQYQLHRDGQAICQNSVHDLDKARRRVGNMFHAFKISAGRSDLEILDVGCGLGYYTKALASTGARVTGIDLSQVGVDVARKTFPECRFRCGAWPEDVEKKAQFDVIWAVDLSVINTFDVHRIYQDFVVEAMARLKLGGCMVVGWSTNFSGRNIGNWSHWSAGMFKSLNKVCGLSSPMVAETRKPWMSSIIIRTGQLFGKSVPIFMFRRKNEQI